MSMSTRDTKSLIGANIRHLREESGRSIAELCEPQGWSRAFWNDLERGKKTASLQRLEEIARILSRALGSDVSVRDLLTERRSRKEPAGARR